MLPHKFEKQQQNKFQGIAGWKSTESKWRPLQGGKINKEINKMCSEHNNRLT